MLEAFREKWFEFCKSTKSQHLYVSIEHHYEDYRPKIKLSEKKRNGFVKENFEKYSEDQSESNEKSKHDNKWLIQVFQIIHLMVFFIERLIFYIFLLIFVGASNIM